MLLDYRKVSGHYNVMIMPKLMSWGVPPVLLKGVHSFLHIESNVPEWVFYIHNGLIKYVRVFKSLLLTEMNALCTYDTHQLEALQFAGRCCFYHRNRLYQ